MTYLNVKYQPTYYYVYFAYYVSKDDLLVIETNHSKQIHIERERTTGI